MTDYKPGDRVRVTLDGFVTIGPPSASGKYRVAENIHGDLAWAWVRAEHMERLPDPEPDWQPGERVRAADGHTYAKSQSKKLWVRITEPEEFVKALYSDEMVSRPLVPLVRGGKPWGES